MNDIYININKVAEIKGLKSTRSIRMAINNGKYKARTIPVTINETYYTKNLKFAKEFFNENINALYQSDGFDAINSLFLKLTQKLMFNIHEIEDDYDVFVAFETMNNRGKKLTNLELLKNRLIGELYVKR